MKTITTFILIAVVAFGLAGCGAPANNAPVNANTNTAPKEPAPPTLEALAALDKAASEAYFKGDAKYFESFLSESFGGSVDGKHVTKADALKAIATARCDVKEFKMEDPQMSPIDKDTVVFSYKATFDGSCTEDGKKVPTPSPARAATVFIRSGATWLAAFHTEVPIIEPQGDPKRAATKEEPGKETKKAEPAKKEEPNKDEAGIEEPKNDASATTEKKPIAATKTASANATGVPPPPKPGLNTDALVKLELASWTAWKDKDQKAIEALVADDLAFVDALGQWFGNRRDVLKYWENTSGCQNVTKVDVKNGFAWPLSPTVEILTFDATADGTCGGVKLGKFNSMSVYVKEDGAWKLAFTVNQLAGKN